MASGKRASMREGPLAQLFRKTDDDSAEEQQAQAAAPVQVGGALAGDGLLDHGRLAHVLAMRC